MKVRTTALVLALALSVSLLSACGGKDNADQSAADDGDLGMQVLV